MSGHGFETGVPQAATADVEVTLDITPGVRHVLQAYYPILDEAAVAPGSSCRRISPAQNASPHSERKKRYGEQEPRSVRPKKFLKQRTAGDRRS